ncbi:hypothetical protein BJ322DRAFT_1024323 [Thelephora terrestris]|uniref:Uncharacterized protein n=1 Tax=Thelephora terrestris TaxID=56493 RepID=A0A9P6L2F6_9AGAM|nr:hypothetical protein BJ322DRAFT_1024323 [Thelephora terrestris]
MSKGQCAIMRRGDEGRNGRVWFSTAGSGGTGVQKFVYQIDWRWLETVAGVSKKRGTRHRISVAALDLESALPYCSVSGFAGSLELWLEAPHRQTLSAAGGGKPMG